MSHHNSGPRAHELPVADITDLYVFPAPGAPGRLTLVLDLVPYAEPSALFSEALVYRFRVRPVTPDPSQASRFAVGTEAEELTVDVTFAPPVAPDDGTAPTQQGTVVTSAGGSVTFAVNDEAGGSADGLRAFAGPRWDPFFSDATALVRTITDAKLAFTGSGTILGDGKNVLSIVVELDCATYLPGRSTVAVVGETVIAGPIPVRWERFGRPELENAILGMKQYDTLNRDLEIRDLFNAEDAFALGPDYVGAYRARLNANLAMWDGLDGTTDWPPAADGTHPLTELLLTDVTIVDVTKPYGEDTFLEIERAAVAGRAHETCGGRSLNDDCMDTLYTFLVNAAKGPRITDGVDGPTRRASQTFPYLVPPNQDPPDPGHH